MPASLAVADDRCGPPRGGLASRERARGNKVEAGGVGREGSTIQEACKRELDDKAFKYVGVAGVDKPRIVRVDVGVEHPPRDK